MERYLSAARKLSRLAMGLPPRSVLTTYDVPLNLIKPIARVRTFRSGREEGDCVLYGNFPVDGEYVIKVRLQTNYVDYIRGLNTRHQIEMALLTACASSSLGWAATSLANLPPRVSKEISWGIPSGNPTCTTRTRAWKSAFPCGRVHVLWVLRSTRLVEGRRNPPAASERLCPRYQCYAGRQIRPFGSVTISGPSHDRRTGRDTQPARDFVCRPKRNTDEERCAKTILSTLARRAYRRPVTDREVRTLLGFYEAGGAGELRRGIQLAVERLLADPNFLLRIEREPPSVTPATAYRLSDLELASRLSFFLWSSIPDDELLDVAVRGKLKDPKVLEQQVRRMLADARSTALVDNFAGQWLLLRNIRSVLPNPEVFPEFDDNLREAFEQETEAVPREPAARGSEHAGAC